MTETVAAPPRYLLEMGGTCGSSPSQTVWAVTSTYAVGDLHVGVRASSTRLKSVLDDLLADRLVPDGQAPANFSVDFGDPQQGKSVLFLLRGSAKLVRSRDPHRVATGLLRYLDGLAEPPDDGRLRTMMTALVHRGRAVLVPRMALAQPEVVERRLRAQGIVALDAPYVVVDPDTGDLVVPEAVPLPGRVADRLDALVPQATREEVVAAGRYPIAGVVGFVDPGSGPPSLARVVHAAVSQRAHDEDRTPAATRSPGS